VQAARTNNRKPTEHGRSVRLIPVIAYTGLHQQWYIEAGGGAHALLQAGADLVDQVFADLQYQFVVNLHHYPGIQAGVLQPGIHLDHGALDDVCCGALHRRVDRGAFGTLAHGLVLRMDLRQVQAAAEQGLDVTLVRSLDAGVFHVAQHARVAGEVAVDTVLGLLAIDTDRLGQAEGAHAVDQAEVDRLGTAPLVGGDLLQRYAEHLGGGGAVHVQTLAEGIEQALVLGQVRHDAQLDLRIVRGHDAVARGGDEGLADAPPLGGADRDVLQVRVRGGQPAGGGERPLVTGVGTAGGRAALLGRAARAGALWQR